MIFSQIRSSLTPNQYTKCKVWVKRFKNLFFSFGGTKNDQKSSNSFFTWMGSSNASFVGCWKKLYKKEKNTDLRRAGCAEDALRLSHWQSAQQRSVDADDFVARPQSAVLVRDAAQLQLEHKVAVADRQRRRQSQLAPRRRVDAKRLETGDALQPDHFQFGGVDGAAWLAVAAEARRAPLQGSGLAERGAASAAVAHDARCALLAARSIAVVARLGGGNLNSGIAKELKISSRLLLIFLSGCKKVQKCKKSWIMKNMYLFWNF